MDFLERVRQEPADPATSGRLAVAWLQAMSNALGVIPRRQSHAEPYASWLAARRPLVVDNEPGGQWILRRDAILEVHAREADTASADDIAWFLSTNGLPGECEAFVPCYVRRANELEGEYLRRHSAGRHAADAVARIAEIAAQWSPRASGPFFYDAARDCAELTAGLGPLRAAVAATRVDRRSAALEALDATAAACSGRRDSIRPVR